MKLERDQLQKLAAERLIVSKFGLERFSSDSELIKFYTGFPTYKHILFFYEFVKPSAENMVYCYATRAEENRRSTHTMHIIDEMFMFLVRIKLGLFGIGKLTFKPRCCH